MRLRQAIFLSLAVHLLVFAPPIFWSSAPVPNPQPRITVSIEPQHEPESRLQDSTTEPASPNRNRAEAAQRLGKFRRQAQSAISRQLLYPPEAIQHGIEGDVTLLLVLDRDGRVQTAEVARSSGHAILDAAALAAAKRLGRLPGNPRESLVPISFRLD